MKEFKQQIGLFETENIVAVAGRVQLAKLEYLASLFLLYEAAEQRRLNTKYIPQKDQLVNLAGHVSNDLERKRQKNVLVFYSNF